MKEQVKKELSERLAKQMDLSKAFQSLFESENGKLVLSELSRMCNENKPTYVDQNPNGSAYKEGQRSVILGIRNQLNKEFNKPDQETAEL